MLTTVWYNYIHVGIALNNCTHPPTGRIHSAKHERGKLAKGMSIIDHDVDDEPDGVGKLKAVKE